MLRNFTPRLYQQTILGTAARHNTLVVLPTGLGKTAVAFILTAQRLQNYPNSKILMLAPTKPLCEQHVESFRRYLEIAPEKVVLFTGSVSPEKRALLWKEAHIINSRINLKEVSLLIFDEAHHATGEYAYVWIANQYDKTSPTARILALTASPGSDIETVKEVTTNLKIEKVEVRTEKDADVKPYVQTTHKNWVEVEFPQELRKIQLLLKDCRRSKLIEAQNLGYCSDLEMSKGALLALQLELQKKLSSGFRDFEVLRSISVIAEAMKVDHAVELLETQGIKPLQSYFKKMQQDALTSKVKAVQNLMQDELFKSSMHFTEELAKQNVIHPKMLKMKEILQETIGKESTAKVIVFTQFRDSAEEIVKNVNELNIKNHIFVGQAKKNGLGFSQKQQKEILDKFSQGEFNILVATSVAEEG